MLTRNQRANVVTARQTILRAASGHEDADGRSLTTCPACRVNWYA